MEWKGCLSLFFNFVIIKKLFYYWTKSGNSLLFLKNCIHLDSVLSCFILLYLCLSRMYSSRLRVFPCTMSLFADGPFISGDFCLRIFVDS